jgi:hypothetical protein
VRLLVGGLVLVGIARVLAIFTENVNWDEFALLQRAVLTLQAGEVQAGGRPGLGTLALIPFAADCLNAVDTLRTIRHFWTGMVLLSGGAFWILLRRVLDRTARTDLGAALGLALWVLPPPFLLYSVQVRTDQPAILFGLLGGLALLRSQAGSGWAIASGVLFGIGFLFTQKLLYVGALVGVLCLLAQAGVRDWNWRRESVRALLVMAGFALALVAYRVVSSPLAPPVDLLHLGGGLRGFEQYRAYVGWAHYRAMLPFLIPHLILLAFLPLLTVRWWRRRDGEETVLLMGAWALLALGTFIAIFHAGRFPYFFMVLGLFPAAAGALLIGPVLDLARGFLPRAALLILVCLPLVAFGLLQAGFARVDTQSHQRESLAFVNRNFPPNERGFTARGEFACRWDPDPFPTRFTSRVLSEFGGPEGLERAEEVADEIRRREVAFLILPLEREPYPEALWEFWRAAFVPYHQAVWVAGTRVHGEAGWTGRTEVVTPGTYRWRPDAGTSSQLRVGGHTLGPGEEVHLGTAGHFALALPQGGSGTFVLSLPEEPAPPATFYRDLHPRSVAVPLFGRSFGGEEPPAR